MGTRWFVENNMKENNDSIEILKWLKKEIKDFGGGNKQKENIELH
jgi:hypothetical protein